MKPAKNVNEAFVASHSCTKETALSYKLRALGLPILPEAQRLFHLFPKVKVSDTTGDAMKNKSW